MEARQPHSILIVDDEQATRRIMVRLLSALGYERLYEACSASEALDVLGRIRPALVLTDLTMESERAGFDVVRFATAQGIAVAVVSGHTPCLPVDLTGTKWFAKDMLSLAFLARELPALLASAERSGEG